MNTELMFSSETDLWSTPQGFYDNLHAEFGFETDVCALSSNAKCHHYFTPEVDGLAQRWTGVCWMNPPYGDPEFPCKRNAKGEYNCSKKRCVQRGYHIDAYAPGVIDWMRKAYISARCDGATVVCLVPARTDTEWWHSYAMAANDIRFIRGRLKFGGMKNSAPFPSAVVVFLGR